MDFGYFQRCGCSALGYHGQLNPRPPLSVSAAITYIISLSHPRATPKSLQVFKNHISQVDACIFTFCSDIEAHKCHSLLRAEHRTPLNKVDLKRESTYIAIICFHRSSNEKSMQKYFRRSNSADLGLSERGEGTTRQTWVQENQQ